MKYYKKPNGDVWAFEADGSQDELITDDMTAMSEQEIEAHINPKPTLDDLRARALAALPVWEESERAGGIEHAGQRWLTTPAALQDIRDVLLANTLPGGAWLNESRALVPMTFQGLQELWGVMVGRGLAIYQRRLQMEGAIPDMNAEQLAAFEPGWPA